ncbi:MAG: hypothetical protein OXR62_04170 [Ahrensia sp.]|nr:hypothetical protein [Ahrensia sp.]
MSHNQGDLFGKPQGDLFEPEKIELPPIDVEDVRQELLEVLEEAKAASTMPWPPREVLFHKTVFPQMSEWLPDDEAAALRQEFEQEIRRLEAA